MRESPVLTTELTLALKRSVVPVESAQDEKGDEVRRFRRTVGEYLQASAKIWKSGSFNSVLGDRMRLWRMNLCLRVRM